MSEVQTQPKNKHVNQGAPLSNELPQAHSMMSTPSEKVRTWTFTIPKSVRTSAGDPQEVTLKELTADQQQEADRLALGNRIKLGNELSKASLYAVDGKRVDHGEFESDVYWNRWSAKVRQLVIAGYGKIHNTDDAEDQSFFDSMRAG